MRRKKKCDPEILSDPESPGLDPFLRRRKVQGTLIKKMLAEFDLPATTEGDLKPEDKMNYLEFEQEGNDNKVL